jgi:hypothetical protein
VCVCVYVCIYTRRERAYAEVKKHAKVLEGTVSARDKQVAEQQQHLQRGASGNREQQRTDTETIAVGT